MHVTGEMFAFFFFGGMMLVAAAGVVLARNPVYAAMNLVAAFFFMAGIYVLLVAHLIAFMQILVYAGAVMVLFLFVIMLLSIHEERFVQHRTRAMQWLGAAGALGIFAVLAAAIWRASGLRLIARDGAGAYLGTDLWVPPNAPQLDAAFGTVKAVGKVLFTDYLLPFEATSLLLLVAIVGSVVVAKERI